MFILGPTGVESVRGLTRERPWRWRRLIDALLRRARVAAEEAADSQEPVRIDREA